MANSIPKKRAKAEQLRKERAQAAGVWLTAAKVPPRPIVVSARRSRPSVGRAGATKTPEPLPPAHYPVKRVASGRRQVPGGAKP